MGGGLLKAKLTETEIPTTDTTCNLTGHVLLHAEVGGSCRGKERAGGYLLLLFDLMMV